VLVWMLERPPGERESPLTDDPTRELKVVLDEPLSGRVLIDGCAQLVSPMPYETGCAPSVPRFSLGPHTDGERLDAGGVLARRRRSA
jgi:hypothetical protein